MQHSKTNRLPKRAYKYIFLRKLLEHYGLTWKLRFMQNNVDGSRCYACDPLFKGKIFSIPYTISLRTDMSDTELNNDVRLDLNNQITLRLLEHFYELTYFSGTKEMQNVSKQLETIIVYTNQDRFMIDAAIYAIDFTHLVQSMILDGIPLDEFPSIEDVI